MRVYELAKQLGMENRDLIPELKRLGITVASHSSALEPDAVQKALEKLGPKHKTGKAATKTGESDSGRSDRHRDADGSSHHHVAAKGAGAHPAAAEEAKPDKRRILIKRKRTDEASVEEPAPLGSEPLAAHMAETTTSALVPSHAPVESPVVHHPEAHPHGGTLAQPSVGTIEHATAPKPVAAPSPDVVSGKKKALEELQAEGLKDKLKKVRKPGRPREEDELRVREDAARWQDLRAIPVQRRDDRSKHVHHSTPAEITKPRKKSVKLTPGMTVKEFAESLGQRPTDIVRKLMDMGQMLTFNQPMNVDAASMIAEETGVKIEVSVEKAGEELLEDITQTEGEARPETRPPVVTIMGHVDHGKTSLLDAIRETKVAEGEAGGITQHIGAYTVTVRGKQVTFLDTPGHEAFTAMRARGAKVTDIVVLVVAADEGVMPQTIEAVNHAKAASVPIIVALNKIDRPEANADRVKQQLTEVGLIPEDYGGDTIVVPVSARTHEGIERLLEMILLQADLMELKANPNRSARGTVVESQLDRGRGPVATVLIQEGTLHTGDPFVCGTTYGRVRAMLDFNGQRIAEAPPSTPVEIFGLSSVPEPGTPFVVVADEAK